MVFLGNLGYFRTFQMFPWLRKELVMLQSSEKLEAWIFNHKYLTFSATSGCKVFKRAYIWKVPVSTGVTIITQVRFLTERGGSIQICLDIYIVTWFCSVSYVRVCVCGLKINCDGSGCVRSVSAQVHGKRLGVFCRWSRTVMEKDSLNGCANCQWICENITLSGVCLKTLSWSCCYLSRLEVQGSLEVARMQIPVLPIPRLGFIFEKRWFLRICSSKRHVGYADVATLPDLKFRKQKIVFSYINIF